MKVGSYKRRAKFGKLSEKIGQVFGKLPLGPNHWTMLTIVIVSISAYFVTQGEFLLASVLLLLSAFLDMVDGAVARATNKATLFGGFFDTVVDRYVEGIIIFSLLFAQLPDFILPSSAWILLALFGSMITTYVKAAAKEKELVPKGKEVVGGVVERGERLLLLFFGILLASQNIIFLTYSIVGLAVLSNIAGLQRIWCASKFR